MRLAGRERMELMARSARKVQPDPQVLLVPPVRRVGLARPVRMELMALSDRRVPLGPPVLLVPQVRLVPRVRTELTEQSDRKVRWDQQVQRARMALTAR